MRTDVNGNSYETCQGLPYGDGQACVGGDPSPMHFTGKQRDTESNLDDFPARYYSSTQGRWLTADWSVTPEPVPYAKLGDPQSLNLYAYVDNDPSNHADPDGHACYDKNKGCHPTDVKRDKLTKEQYKALLLIIAAVRGHHGVPQSLIKLLPKGSEIRGALEKWTTGSLEGNHYYDAAHRLYNKAVENLTRLRDPEAQEQLIADGVKGAKKLGQDVLDSENPAVKGFLDNMKTTDGMTGREALEKTLTGDGEAAGQFVSGAIGEAVETVVKDVPIE